MIYLTQLIYLKEGQEAVFHEFESMAIPIISHYKGQLLHLKEQSIRAQLLIKGVSL